MSTVIEQPRQDVPIVADATLLAVPNQYDDAGRAEYLKKLRALRNQPSEPEVPSRPQNVEASEPVQDVDTGEPETIEDTVVEDSSDDAIPQSEPQSTQSGRIRLSQEDLQGYEIPVRGENGEIEYLSYEDFEKTVGLYSKQNKRSRELAEKEREVEAIKTKLLEQQAQVVSSVDSEAAKLQKRYTWVQNSIAHAHKYGIDVIEFDDGSKKKLTALIAEKTAIENGYSELMSQRAQAEQKLKEAQEDFIRAQDKILEERAPKLKNSRADLAKFLERQGFTAEEANALSYAKAELLLVLDKARRWDDAQKGERKEKKVGSNTKVLKQPSRLSGRGTPVNNTSITRMQELQAKGSKASADELRELRRLQLSNR